MLYTGMMKARSTWGSCDVHGFQVPGFDDGDGQPTRRRQIAEWKHQVTQVHVVLRDNHNAKRTLSVLIISSPLESITHHPEKQITLSSLSKPDKQQHLLTLLSKGVKQPGRSLIVRPKRKHSAGDTDVLQTYERFLWELLIQWRAWKSARPSSCVRTFPEAFPQSWESCIFPCSSFPFHTHRRSKAFELINTYLKNSAMFTRTTHHGFIETQLWWRIKQQLMSWIMNVMNMSVRFTH